MADELIDKIVGPGFHEDALSIKDLTVTLKELVGGMLEANATAKKAEGFASQAGTIKDLHTSTRSLVDANGNLATATTVLNGKLKEAATIIPVLNGHSKEHVQVQQEIIRLNILEERLLKAKTTATKVQVDAYGLLSKQYNAAAREAQNLAAQYGVEDARAKAAAKSANDLSDKLKAIDSSVGRNQRKVGEYENATKGLSGSLMSLSQGFRNSGNEIDALGRILGFSKGTLDDFRIALEHGTRTLAVFFDAFGKKLAGKAVEEVDDLTAAVDEQTDSLKEAVVEKAKEAASEKLNTIVSGENTVAVEANAAATVSAGVAAAANSVALDANTIAMHSNVAAYTVQIAQGRAYAVVGAISTATTEANAVALGEATIAQGALATATTATTIATRLLTITLLASGVGVVIALVALAVIAYQNWKESTEAARLAHEQFKKALESTDYKDAIENVAKLTDNLKLAKEGLIDKTDVVEEYNKSIGEAAGKVTDLDGVEQGLVAHKDAYVRMMFFKAAAASAYKEAVDKAVKSQTDLAEVGETPGITDYLGAIPGQVTADVRRQQEAEKAKKQSAKLFAISQDFNKKMAEEAQKNGLDAGLGGNIQDGSVAALRQQISLLKQKLDTEKAGSAQQIADTKTLIELERQLKAIEGHTPKAPKGHDDTNAQLKGETEYTAALFEQFKLRSAKSAAEQKAIADDETNNLQKRADAYANYTNERLNEAGLESAKEQSIILQKLDKIKEIEGKAVGTRTNEEKNLLFSKKALEVQLVNVTDNYERVRTGIVEENVKYQEKLIKEYGKDAEEAIKKSIANLKTVGAFAADNNGGSESRAQFENEYAERHKIFDAYFNAGKTTFQTLGDLQSIATQKRLQEIDDEISKIEERKQAEIEYVNGQILSQQDKAEKISGINAKAKAEEDQLNQKRREEMRKNAEIQKAITIATIIAETARAVVSALYDPTVPNFYLRAANAVAAGVTGASQLAIAIATPLPSYEEGTDNHPGGPARMFEKDKPELVIEPSGKTWIGKKEGVYDIPKGTQVIPGIMEETMALSRMYALGLPALIPMQGGGSFDTSKLEQKLDNVERAINNKPVTENNFTGMGLQTFIRAGNSTIERLNNLKH